MQRLPVVLFCVCNFIMPSGILDKEDDMEGQNHTSWEKEICVWINICFLNLNYLQAEKVWDVCKKLYFQLLNSPKLKD